MIVRMGGCCGSVSVVVANWAARFVLKLDGHVMDVELSRHRVHD